MMRSRAIHIAFTRAQIQTIHYTLFVNKSEQDLFETGFSFHFEIYEPPSHIILLQEMQIQHLRTIKYVCTRNVCKRILYTRETVFSDLVLIA